MDKYHVMEYLYRDADNFKAFGGILVLCKIPDTELSEPARLFGLKMLSINQNRLLNLKLK